MALIRIGLFLGAIEGIVFDTMLIQNFQVLDLRSRVEVRQVCNILVVKKNSSTIDFVMKVF